MVPADLVERERQALRDSTDAQLAGVSQGQIAIDWNEQGLRDATGREWTSIAVRTVLLRPTNAGLIEYGDQLVARIPGEPIVDPQKFDRLRAMYAARRRGRIVGRRPHAARAEGSTHGATSQHPPNATSERAA